MQYAFELQQCTVQKFTAYLNIKRKKVTKLWSNLLWSSLQTHWWYERRSWTATSLLTSETHISPKKCKQKKKRQHLNTYAWHYSSCIKYSFNEVSNLSRQLWSFTVGGAFRYLNSRALCNIKVCFWFVKQGVTPCSSLGSRQVNGKVNHNPLLVVWIARRVPVHTQ